MTFTTADGTVYSVNDVAVAHALGRDISVITRTADPIWITDPQTQSRVQLAAPATSIAPLVEEGLKLCPER